MPILPTMAVGDAIPELAGITPAQCRTMVVRSATDVQIDPAHDDAAESNAQQTSHQSKQIRALRSQRAEIIKHHRKLVRRHGYDVSLDEAARDWIQNHAADWRKRYESGHDDD